MLIPPDIRGLLFGPEPSVRIFKSGPASQMYVAQALLDQGRDVVVIVPPTVDIHVYASLARLFAAEDPGLPFWKQRWIVFPSFPLEQARRSPWPERWKALYSLAHSQGPRGILLPLDAVIHKWPAQSVLEREHLQVHTADELGQEDLLETLVNWGYRRVSMVTAVGEVALRGDIMDVFCPGYEYPLRVEFFGDTIEQIKLFEPLSQRSKADMATAHILPVVGCIGGTTYGKAARELLDGWVRLGELSRPARADLEKMLLDARPDLLPSMYYPDCVGLEQWLPKQAVYIMAEAQDVRPKLDEVDWAWQTYFRDETRQWPRHGLVLTPGDARKLWEDRRQILCESLVMGVREAGVELVEERVSCFEDLFWDPEERKRPWRALMQSMHDWKRTYAQTILCFHTEHSRTKFLHLAAQDGQHVQTAYEASAKGVFALVGSMAQGMRLVWTHVQILPESVLQPGVPKAQRAAAKAFKGLDSFDELETDDLLVHRDYGLCRFGGLHRVRFGDVANDYLLLQYDGDDKLYVPVDRLNQVQRYKGPDGANPALDRLGGAAWTKARERVRQSVAKIAHDLVEMYAYRKIAKGFTYAPISELYWEFEASFGFEETKDQERAIADVLADMERPEPMDRLVCGDVGFGKTEVALRAAFRAVLDGKQVALLCPTTVLAEQHYQTFRQRMEPFSISVGLLSRFVPASAQKRVTQAVRNGQVDILIGTHRMLSKDVEFARLALLILDEEQRFGVKHKERIKKMRSTIDVLTLTATPIPRTLQLSLSGIRALSVIETPPKDRKPVQTSLMERDADQLKTIIDRELSRGGQVFWVYNRVQGLERVVEYVRGLAPQARIGMGHGQMKAQELEETMHRFWHGELDILVCTAIIESGLDFPRANTLIVDQAQLFGLGQLYQLRGRVGRSAEQAYAYFIIPDVERLQETARKRMKIILDMDYLGAGFKVAMEDLRLRGAGNILGEAQSGTIGKVGLDLFLDMLEEEVHRLQGGKVETEIEPEINLGFQALIPEEYIADGKQRLQYYKELSSCRDEAGIADLVDDMRDRFGLLPEMVRIFVAVLLIKIDARRLGAVRVDLFADRLVLHWDETRHHLDLTALMAWVTEQAEQVRLLPPAKVEVRLTHQASGTQNMEAFKTMLAGLRQRIIVAPDGPQGQDQALR
ncbi:MAG: transcription-repair coupling factor [Desulfovibrionales bacterium]|nr:transcription-repair coupling factor [Desulfovibrionales bacterium]